jgi:hypothetical protein
MRQALQMQTCQPLQLSKGHPESFGSRQFELSDLGEHCLKPMRI